MRVTERWSIGRRRSRTSSRRRRSNPSSRYRRMRSANFWSARRKDRRIHTATATPAATSTSRESAMALTDTLRRASRQTLPTPPTVDLTSASPSDDIVLRQERDYGGSTLGEGPPYVRTPIVDG